jgi:hypothetical protein
MSDAIVPASHADGGSLSETQSGVLAETSSPAVLIPEVPMMSKQTYASPMSYVGSSRRATAFVRRVGTSPIRASLAWTAAALFVGVMWFAVLPVWYFVTIILFGWFMIPFRLVRRSHRKQEHIQKTQLATMQAMMIQQQQALKNPPE